ncbi:MAG: NADH:flavin oxidoreductase [Peptococcaceae bacterium]|jgi:2,4-dienoyl-CoA reductase-like NADH-dependent reductase (Old Yellow Enzyme family)|nr:NADH:flavin oxidoreductase [Peptococcaceae bacterium]
MVFEPGKIKGMVTRNRFVRSATYDGLAERDGRVSAGQMRLYADMADGGVGLIVSGIACVHPGGRISPVQNSIAGDEFTPGLQRLTRAVHDRGAKIALQLFHGGREAKYIKTRNAVPLAPSVVEADPYYEGVHRAMTEDEIREVVAAFGDGAQRARIAGFDAVQVHGAHAYLLSQFLSPHTNRRQDEWGGSMDNRLRLHREIYSDIRRKAGPDYPVLIKLGVEDGFPGGLRFAEGKQAALRLAELGFDALEISQGLRGERYEGTEYRARIDAPDREAYNRAWCREIKARVNVPVMLGGGLRTLSLMEEIVQDQEADFVSLCRPLICEPGLINEWRAGRDKKARYLSCNNCVKMIFKGKPARCIHSPAEKDPGTAVLV